MLFHTFFRICLSVIHHLQKISHPPIPRAASTSDPKLFDAIAVPPLLYKAANDAMSKFPLAGVSSEKETGACDTSDTGEAVVEAVALLAANELMLTEEILESFELLIFENKL